MSVDIFQQYYCADMDLVDRYLDTPELAVDVIIPTYNTNSLWRANLHSVYREIPVHRLLIGDGGCTDNTLKIASEFPRVEIIDQRHRKSLGYCIKELICMVSTEWFVYLHSDVYLPEGWFDVMLSYQSRFDWFECNRRKTVLLDYMDVWQNSQSRPFSGSQMGRKEIFELFLDRIDDDYLYRNEDIVLREMVESHGGRYGRVSETFHYHQVMNKQSLSEPDFIRVTFTRNRDIGWIVKTHDMQARGIIKYTQPDKTYLIKSVQSSLRILRQHGALDFKEFCAWTARINPRWLPYVKKGGSRIDEVRQEVLNIARSLGRIVKIFVPAASRL